MILNVQTMQIINHNSARGAVVKLLDDDKKTITKFIIGKITQRTSHVLFKADTSQFQPVTGSLDDLTGIAIRECERIRDIYSRGSNVGAD